MSLMEQYRALPSNFKHYRALPRLVQSCLNVDLFHGFVEYKINIIEEIVHFESRTDCFGIPGLAHICSAKPQAPRPSVGCGPRQMENVLVAWQNCATGMLLLACGANLQVQSLFVDNVHLTLP